MLHFAGVQGLSGPAIDVRDPIIGLLFSLVAASAHIIVPAAVFNLKVRPTLPLWVNPLLACDIISWLGTQGVPFFQTSST